MADDERSWEEVVDHITSKPAAITTVVRTFLSDGTRKGDVVVSRRVAPTDALQALQSYAAGQGWAASDISEEDFTAIIARVELAWAVNDMLTKNVAAAPAMLASLLADGTTVTVPDAAGYQRTVPPPATAPAGTKPTVFAIEGVPGFSVVVGPDAPAPACAEALVYVLSRTKPLDVTPQQAVDTRSSLKMAFTLATATGAPVAALYKALPPPKYVNLTQTASRDHLAADLDGLLKFGGAAVGGDAAAKGGYPLAMINASLSLFSRLRVTSKEVFAQQLFAGRGSQTAQLHRDLLRAFMLLCCPIELYDHDFHREVSCEVTVSVEGGQDYQRQLYRLARATPESTVRSVFDASWDAFLHRTRPSSVALSETSADTGNTIAEIEAIAAAAKAAREENDRLIERGEMSEEDRLSGARVALGGTTLALATRMVSASTADQLTTAVGLPAELTPEDPLVAAAQILRVVDVGQVPVIALAGPQDFEYSQGDATGPVYRRSLWASEPMTLEQHVLANKAMATVIRSAALAAEAHAVALTAPANCPVQASAVRPLVSSLLTGVRPSALAVGGWRYVVMVSALASALKAAAAGGAPLPLASAQAVLLHIGLLNNLPLQARSFNAALVAEAARASPAAKFLLEDMVPHIRAALEAAMGIMVDGGAEFSVEEDEDADGEVEDEDAEGDKLLAARLAALPRWNLADMYHLPLVLITEAMMASKTGPFSPEAVSGADLLAHLRKLFPSVEEFEASQGEDDDEEGAGAKGVSPSPTAVSMALAFRWVSATLTKTGGVPADKLATWSVLGAGAEADASAASLLEDLENSHEITASEIADDVALGQSAFPRSKILDTVLGRSGAAATPADAAVPLLPAAVPDDCLRDSFLGSAVGLLDLSDPMIIMQQLREAAFTGPKRPVRIDGRDEARTEARNQAKRETVGRSLLGYYNPVTLKKGDEVDHSRTKKNVNEYKAKVSMLATRVREASTAIGKGIWNTARALEELTKPAYNYCDDEILGEGDDRREARWLDMEVDFMRAETHYKRWNLVSVDLIKQMEALEDMDSEDEDTDIEEARAACARRAEQEERVAGEAFDAIEKLIAKYWPSLHATFRTRETGTYDAKVSLRAAWEDVMATSKEGLQKAKTLRTHLMDLNCATGIVARLSTAIISAAAVQKIAGFSSLPTSTPVVKRSADLTYVKWQLKTLGAFMERPQGRPDPKGRTKYKLDDWQLQVLEQVDTFDDPIPENRKSTLLLAPTSSGKTFLAVDYPISKLLRTDDDSVLIFVVPTRELADQVVYEMDSRFRKHYPDSDSSKSPKNLTEVKFYSMWSSELHYGDVENTRVVRINPDGSRLTECLVVDKATGECQWSRRPATQVVVATPEAVEMLLSNAFMHNWANRIKYVVLDEVHNFLSEYGHVWETLMLRLACPMVAMSATVGGPEHMWQWMSRVEAARGRAMPARIECFSRYNDLAQSVWRPAGGSITKPRVEAVSPVAALDWSALSPHAPDVQIELLPEHTVPLHATLESVLKAGDAAARAARAENAGNIASLLRRVQRLSPDSHFAGHADSRITLREAHDYGKLLVKALRALGAVSQEMCMEVVNRIRAPVDAAFAALDEQTGRTGYRQWLLDNLHDLVISLRDARLLPAIIFNLERRGADMMALALADVLTRKEAAHRNSEAFAEELEPKMNQLALKRARRDELQNKLERADRAGGGSRGARDRGNEKKRELDEMRQELEQVMGEVKKLEEEMNDLQDSSVPLPKYCFTMPGATTRGISAHDIAAVLNISVERYKEMEEAETMAGRRWRALRRGIAVHHPRINKHYRLAVEVLFRQKRIMALFATSGMAQGINAPCRSVVIAGDSVKLDAVIFKQMSGRAGRRGYDNRGDVIFYGVPTMRVMQLLTASMPDVTPHWTLSTTTAARALAQFRSSVVQMQATRRDNPPVYEDLNTETTNIVNGFSRICRESLLRSYKDGADNLVEMQGGCGVDRLQRAAAVMQLDLLRSLRMASAVNGAPTSLTGLLAHLYHEEPGAVAGMVSLLLSGALKTVVRDIATYDVGSGSGVGALSLPWVHGGPIPVGEKRPTVEVWRTIGERDRAIDSALLHTIAFVLDRLPARAPSMRGAVDAATGVRVGTAADHTFGLDALHPEVRATIAQHNNAVRRIVLHYHRAAVLEAAAANVVPPAEEDGAPRFVPSTTKEELGLQARGADVRMTETVDEDGETTQTPAVALPNPGGLYGAVAALSQAYTLRDPFEATAGKTDSFADLDEFARAARPDLHLDASVWPEVRRPSAPRSRYLLSTYSTGSRSLIEPYFRIDDENFYDRMQRLTMTVRCLALAVGKAYLNSQFSWSSLDEAKLEALINEMPEPAPRSDAAYDRMLVRSLLHLARRFTAMADTLI